jgi:hypothetical protein
MAEIASSRCALLAMTASTKPSTSLRAKRSNLASRAPADVSFCNFDTMLSPYICRTVRERCRAAHPGGLPSKLSVSNPSPLQQRVAERRNSRAGTPTHWPPYGWACPFSGRELPIHNADRRASRRPTAAFSLDPGTAFWKRTEAPIHEHP